MSNKPTTATLHFVADRGSFSVPVEQVVEVCHRERMGRMPDPDDASLGVVIKDSKAFTVISDVGTSGELILLLQSGSNRAGLVVRGVQLEPFPGKAEPYSISGRGKEE